MGPTSDTDSYPQRNNKELHPPSLAHRLKQLLNKGSSVVSELGPINGLLYGIDRTFVQLGGFVRLYSYCLVAQPVADSRFLPPRRGQAIEVRNIGCDDPALASMPLTNNVLQARYRQDSVCLGAFKGGRLIGYLWLCIGSYIEDEVRCRFLCFPEDRASWDYDVYLLPEHRSSLAFARLWDSANEYLRTRGVAWSFSRISAYNSISLSSHRRLKATLLGKSFFLRLAAWQIMVSTLPPYVHISTGPSAVPTIRLYPPTS